MLRRQGFAPFIALLRANMRHAGILRIDHVMSLNRLYWIPSGMEAKAGAYVNYPLRSWSVWLLWRAGARPAPLLGKISALCPTGFAMPCDQPIYYRTESSSLSARLTGHSCGRANTRRLAAASAATHDIATLKGFWLGNDISWRRRLGLYPDRHAEEAEAAERHRDRKLLLDALVREGLMAPAQIGEFLPEDGAPVYTTELADAILAYLGRSCARLMLVQLEDVLSEVEQANLPGTTEAHPNWRRRLSRSVEEIDHGVELHRIAALIEVARLGSAREE